MFPFIFKSQTCYCRISSQIVEISSETLEVKLLGLVSSEEKFPFNHIACYDWEIKNICGFSFLQEIKRWTIIIKDHNSNNNCMLSKLHTTFREGYPVMPKLVHTFLLLSSAQSIAARSTAGFHSTTATQHRMQSLRNWINAQNGIDSVFANGFQLHVAKFVLWR